MNKEYLKGFEVNNLLDQSKIEEFLNSAENIESYVPSVLNLRETLITGIKGQIIKNINFPKVYSETRYNKYRHTADILLVVSLILLLAVSFFSYRFGRLFVPGLLLFIATVPGVYVFTTIYKYLKETPLNGLAKSNNEIIRKLASIIIKAKDKQLNILYHVHRNVLIIAIILILSSIVGKIIHYVYIRKQTGQKTKK